ncbi:MAG: YigZ family protein [Bacteroidales bacterium]|nr:YigZ family protein [Bacteroidales bacterium]
METDEFLTIARPSEGSYKEKGSKFLAFAFPVESEQEVKNRLDTLRNQYHDARHHCYAYLLGPGMDIYRMNDDGEPSSTGGKPIFGQIRSYNLTNVLVVVTRYFGGILLGTSGLIRAYKSAAGNALENATIAKKTIQSHYRVSFDYSLMSNVEKVLHDLDIRPWEKTFEEHCMYKIAIRKTLEQKMVEKLKHIKGLQCTKIENP